MRFLPLLVLLPTFLHAVEIRVATFNIGGDFGNNCGICDATTVDHIAVRSSIARIDPDVINLQEIFDGDVSGNSDDLGVLAASLGYPHIYIPTQASLDPFMRSVFLSKFPFITKDRITSPPGANEITRPHPVVKVNVPGTTNDPTLVGLHLKSGTGSDDRFRRALEMRRLNEYLDAQGLTSADNLIILGDFNLDLDPNTSSFLAEPSGLPGSFNLGADIQAEFNSNISLGYTEFPEDYLSTPAMNRLVCEKVNGSTSTQFSRTIDHILITDALFNRPHACEVYSSGLDTTQNPGLPKSGTPLPPSTSNDASDHRPVFVDLELDGITLEMTIAPASVEEDDPVGAASLTLTLSDAPGVGESVSVTLSSDDPGEAVALQSAVTFTTGVTTLNIEIIPQADNTLDGDQNVTFTATASGFSETKTNLLVLDSDSPAYSIPAFAVSVAEGFDDFTGDADHPRWVTAGPGLWLGPDDGNSTTAGRYAFGAPTDPSLGLIPGATPTTFTATYQNHTGSTITALELAVDYEQWHGALVGTADTFATTLTAGGSTIPLPSLNFTASTSLSGPSAASTPLSSILSNLNIADGATFSLTFTATRGTGGTTPSPDVFLNEFHYENASDDEGEFVEIVVGPGFTGDLNSIDVVLYNGTASQRSAYDTIPLNTFDNFATPFVAAGYRIYHFTLAPNGLQNGSPDGIAVSIGGTATQFFSYEGTFVAASGPAAGQTSIDVGFSQSNSTTPIGKESIRLTGTGSNAADFTWTKVTGENHTPGTLNPGQTFTTPVLSQGIALDNISLTALLDTDLDGLPDTIDPDDDNDGLPDADEETLGTNPLLADSDSNGTTDDQEDPDGDRQTNGEELILFGSDPLDGASFFDFSLTPNILLTGFNVEFPSVAGITYRVQRSTDLVTFTTISSHPGTGAPISAPAPLAPGFHRSFFRILATQ